MSGLDNRDPYVLFGRNCWNVEARDSWSSHTSNGKELAALVVSSAIPRRTNVWRGALAGV